MPEELPVAILNGQCNMNYFWQKDEVLGKVEYQNDLSIQGRI